MGNCCSDVVQEQQQDMDDGLGDVEEMLRDLGAADEQASSTVTLRIACRELAGRWDPMVYVYEVPADFDPLLFKPHDKKYVGKTESIQGAVSPQFVQTITVFYQFGRVQTLLFECVHEERKGLGRDEARLLGYTTCSLQALIEEKAGTYVADLQLTSGSKVGDIMIKTEVQSKNSGPEYEVLFAFGCEGIESKNMFGASGSDPFLVISRVVNGSFLPVAKTEYWDNVTAVDQWKPLVIKLERLCRMDFNAPLLFEVFDWEKSGRHQIIGCTRTTLAEILAANETRGLALDPTSNNFISYELINEAKRGKEGYVNSGTLILKRVDLETSHSFLEYVRGGFDINLTICVDFSASNRMPHDVTSLHYMDGRRTDNEYVRALRAVLKVVGEYDKDQLFNLYGFGAGTPERGNEPMNIFPVTGDPNRVQVQGIQGVVDEYWSCLNRVTPTEPTKFSSCMMKGLNLASAAHGECYQILLFITDGEIHDLSDTIDVIVMASAEPISVLIIGVGAGPFDDMELLDGDDKPLVASDGKTPGRDLVGFVPYREHRDDPEQLARETLKEIPRQFVKWAKLHKVKPPKVKEEGDNSASSDDGFDPAHPHLPPPVKVTLKKKEAEGLGLKVKEMAIEGAIPGTVADLYRMDMYTGYTITAINGVEVRNEEDLAHHVKGRKKIVMKLRCLDPALLAAHSSHDPHHGMQDSGHRNHPGTSSVSPPGSLPASSFRGGVSRQGSLSPEELRRIGSASGTSYNGAGGMVRMSESGSDHLGDKEKSRSRRRRRDHSSGRKGEGRRRRGDDSSDDGKGRRRSGRHRRHRHHRHHRERREEEVGSAEGSGSGPAYASIMSDRRRRSSKMENSSLTSYDRQASNTGSLRAPLLV